MPYKDAERQREAVRKAVAKHRNVIPSEGITRINPHTGKAYGPLMGGMPEWVLQEYERKWGQMEPCYVEHERRVVKPVLVIGELSQSRKDELYRGLHRAE